MWVFWSIMLSYLNTFWKINLRFTKYAGILSGCVLLIPLSSYAQSLPQEHAYQVTLRDYLATFSEEDFEIELKPLTYKNNYFSTPEEVHREWLVFENIGRFLPPHQGIRSPAHHYTLESIEAEGKVNMRVDYFFHQPATSAWYATWDSPINPYRPGQPGNKEIKNRAFVVAAVDMMMLDQLHESGSYRSDFTSFSLAMYAYVYSVVKDDLSLDVRAAFEEGMIKMFERMEEAGPTGTHGDTNQPAHLAMYFLAKHVDSENLTERAEAYSRKVIEYNFEEAGYIDHGLGFDPSYNGISIDYISMAAIASRYSWLAKTVDKMAKLKSYLSFPEPDGTFRGPSHFSTSTASGSPNDQQPSYWRDNTVAMLSDHGKYLTFKENKHKGIRYQPFDVLDEYTMRRELYSFVETANSVAANPRYSWMWPTDAHPEVWQEVHWQDFPPFLYDYYPSGYYDSLKAIRDNDNPLDSPPFSRTGDFIENFSDEFLIAKVGGYGLAIHTGRLSWWTTKSNGAISGMSGGALSTFWTPETGLTMLGRMRGYSGSTPDTWDNSDTWATHHIWGKNSAGLPFSSARHTHPEVNYEVDGPSKATVTVSGSIGQHDAGKTAPKNAIKGHVVYNRTFSIAPEGLTITTELTSDGADAVSELWESLPIYLGENESQDAAIEVRVGEMWQRASTTIVTTDLIRIRRNNGYVSMNFETPQRVKLSPHVWTTEYQVESRMRNIMVNLLHSNNTEVSMPASVSVTYTLSASKESDDSLPTPVSNDSLSVPASNGFALHQNYPNPFRNTTTFEFEVPESSAVNLSAFDMTGRIVSQLFNRIVSAGKHSFEWERDDLPAGKYVIRMKTEQGVKYRSAILLN